MVGKTKKALNDENKRLKKIIETYTNFWETDAIEECTKQLKFTKKSIYVIIVILLIISAFLLGLSM